MTGKGPYSDLRKNEQRRAKLSITPSFSPKTELDWGLLGYFAGKVNNDSCINFDNTPQPDLRGAKSLSVAMGTSGSCGMFTINHGEETKAITYEPKDASAVKDELSNSEDGDVIVLGSPLARNE